MVKPFFCAVAMAVLIPLGVAGQDHDHGAQPRDAGAMPSADGAPMMQQMHQHMEGMREMMQGMQERMQGMHEMMMQMHGDHPGGAQSMGAQPGGEGGPTCMMGGPESSLSALLYSSVADLGLTEAQRAEWAGILAKAQEEVRASLTDDQRARLEAAPLRAAACAVSHTGGATGSH